MIKQVLTGLMCLAMLNQPIIQNDSFSSVEKEGVDLKAVQVMNEFISANAASDSTWSNHKIVDSEILYDAYNDKYGYVFETYNNFNDGYGIVLECGNSYIVVEASQDTPSPYSGFNDSYKNVYTSLLNYYVFSPTRTNELIDINKNTTVTVNDLKVKRMDLSNVENAKKNFIDKIEFRVC